MRINSLTIGSFSVTANPTSGVGVNNVIELFGLESPQRRVSSFDLPGNHGAFVSNALFGGRVIGIKLQMLGSSASDLVDRLSTLASELDFTGASSEVTVTFTDVEGASFFVKGYARFMSMPGGFGRRNFDEVTIELITEDYRILSSTTKQQTIFLEDTSGGVEIPAIIPISFGVGAGGSRTLTNTGNTKACPVIRLNGPLTNPTIANQTTDEQFKQLSGILVGNYIEIDTNTKTVTDQNGNSVIGSSSTSIRDFWCLAPGDNVITFIHEGVYNDVGNAQITWNDSFLSL